MSETAWTHHQFTIIPIWVFFFIVVVVGLLQYIYIVDSDRQFQERENKNTSIPMVLTLIDKIFRDKIKTGTLFCIFNGDAEAFPA